MLLLPWAQGSLVLGLRQAVMMKLWYMKNKP